MVVSAPAALRNAAPILDVLKRELPNPCRLLEIGSGTGLHGLKAREILPFVEWHPSEVPGSLTNLRQCLAESAPELGERAFALNVDHAAPHCEEYDAAYSCNTAHIMSLDSVARMFERVGEMTNDSAIFLLYGPFLIDGDYTSEGNAQFDRHLRVTNPSMGLRDLEQLDGFADAAGFARQRVYGMPSNNLMVVWARQAEDVQVSSLSD